MNLHEVLLASRMADKNNGNGGNVDLSDYYTKSQTNGLISEKVAEIVANAPEDFDTLKEISDWIANHEDSAAAMNSAIQANTAAITQKADKSTTFTKTEVNTALGDKVDKESGKGLSTNDFTDAYKTKVDSLKNYDDTAVKADIAEVTSQVALNRSTLGYQRKNQLKLTVPPAYNSGVSFSMSDGVLSLNGTSTGYKDCYFPEYTYSVSESDSWIYITEKSILSTYGTLNSLNIAYYKPNVTQHAIFITISNDSPLVLEQGSIIIGLYVRINSGVDYTGKNLSVMLRPTEITDDAYEPYRPSIEERLTALENVISGEN
ncbi:MAG: hypothetical protein K2I06_07075 [Ruminococcus sp.]|nr:hypothetical protein [Ruminococcus sp.]